MKRRGKSRKGQGLVELVIVITFIFLPLFALTLDGARLLFTYHRLQASTREGAKIVTESTSPIEDPAVNGLPGNCSLAACGGAGNICCVAVSRTNAVLFEAGITNPTVNGAWFTLADSGSTYVFLRVTASTAVGFFFRSQSLNVQASSTGYADEF